MYRHTPNSAGSKDQEHAGLTALTNRKQPRKPDYQTGHDYIPMDVFVDPVMRREHFRNASICKRLQREQVV